MVLTPHLLRYYKIYVQQPTHLECDLYFENQHDNSTSLIQPANNLIGIWDSDFDDQHTLILLIYTGRAALSQSAPRFPDSTREPRLGFGTTLR